MSSLAQKSGQGFCYVKKDNYRIQRRLAGVGTGIVADLERSFDTHVH